MPDGKRRIIGDDVDRHEGDRSGITLLQCTSPSVEAGRCEVVALAEGADGEAAALPEFEPAPPLTFLAQGRAVCLGPWWCPPFGEHWTTPVKNGLRRTDTDPLQIPDLSIDP